MILWQMKQFEKKQRNPVSGSGKSQSVSVSLIQHFAARCGVSCQRLGSSSFFGRLMSLQGGKENLNE